VMAAAMWWQGLGSAAELRDGEGRPEHWSVHTVPCWPRANNYSVPNGQQNACAGKQCSSDARQPHSAAASTRKAKRC
jgi:hypothetical protein